MSIDDATYDDLLLRFLECADPVQAEVLLEQLVQDQAVPVVERVVLVRSEDAAKSLALKVSTKHK